METRKQDATVHKIVACFAVDGLVLESSGAQVGKIDCTQRPHFVNTNCGVNKTRVCLLSVFRNRSGDPEIT